MTPLEILGCRLDPVDSDEAASRILTLACEAHGAQIVTLGTEMVVYAQHDVRFRSIVNESALSLCDTVGLLAVARRRGAALRDRVTGVELIERLCEGAARQGLPVYLLGSAPGVVDEAAAALRSRFPNLRIAGTQNGYFSDAQTPEIVQSIAGSGARLLFVGMGSPRQEYWLAEIFAQPGAVLGSASEAPSM